jgi:prepilin-type N-terminal cleavage/methylation domain-containing protein
MKWRSVNKRPGARPDGFTLLEVLISMFLLVVISFATYQATTETFKLRDVLSTEGEFYNSIRLAVSILQRDLENAYSPVVLRPEQRPRALPGQEGQVQQLEELQQVPPPGFGLNREIMQSDFFSSEIDKYGIRPTRMSGTDTKLFWVNAANMRMYRDSRESDFLKISYFLEQEKDSEYEAGSSTLVRSASPEAFIYDESKDKSVKTYRLLHGIRKLKFRYYRKDKDQWSDSWDSESSDTKELFPDIVELQIEVSAPKGLSFEGRYQIRPEVPLNGVPATL